MQLVIRGVHYKFEPFLRWGKIPKKQDIIYHSVDKRFPKFGIFFGLENICILLYTTSDYYGLIKGQTGYSARVLFCFIFFRAKIPFLIKLEQILQKMATYRTNRSIVKWVSGNTVIPTDRTVLVGILDASHLFVIFQSFQECTNNEF